MGKLSVPFAVLLLLCGGSVASAGPVLQDWAISVNGTFVTAGSGLTIPQALSTLAIPGLTVTGSLSPQAGSSFDTTTGNPVSGLGRLDVNVSLQGATENVTVVAWFQYSFSDNNNGWYGDYGTTLNTVSRGEYYALLDYGTVTDPANPDPLASLTSTPSGTNTVGTPGPYDPQGIGDVLCCNVLMGIGYTATVTSGTTNDFLFRIDYSDASGGYHPRSNIFYALQKGPTDGFGNVLSDPNDLRRDTLYLSAGVPEPDGWVLMSGGTLFMAAAALSRKLQQRREQRAKGAGSATTLVAS